MELPFRRYSTAFACCLGEITLEKTIQERPDKRDRGNPADRRPPCRDRGLDDVGGKLERQPGDVFATAFVGNTGRRYPARPWAGRNRFIVAYLIPRCWSCCSII
jgi:hypothetical protein